MKKNFDETTPGSIGPRENIMLKIAKGQHWIEDETNIRYMVIEDPIDLQSIDLHPILGRRSIAFKTVTLAELLAGFTQSFGTRL